MEGVRPLARADRGRTVERADRVYRRLALTERELDDRTRSIDALRAIAALGVLAAHGNLWGVGGHGQTALWRPAPVLAIVGSAGVALFFVLSGYLIAGPFLRAFLDGRPHPDLARYARRRVARILPAYWLALAGLALLAPPAGAKPWQWITHALLIHNQIPGQANTIYFVAWTLGIEAAFYVFVPFAARALAAARGPRVSARGLIILLATTWAAAEAIALTLTLVPSHGTFEKVIEVVAGSNLLGTWALFAAGMIIVVVEHRMRDDRRAARVAAALSGRTALVVAVAAIATTVVIQIEERAGDLPFAWFRLSIDAAAIGFGLVVAGRLLSGRRPGRIVSVLAPVGLISYGIYLWHWLVVQTALRHGVIPLQGAGLRAMVANGIVLLAITIPTATVSWLLVERVALRRAGARRVPAAVAEPELIAEPEPQGVAITR